MASNPYQPEFLFEGDPYNQYNKDNVRASGTPYRSPNPDMSRNAQQNMDFSNKDMVPSGYRREYIGPASELKNRNIDFGDADFRQSDHTDYRVDPNTRQTGLGRADDAAKFQQFDQYGTRIDTGTAPYNRYNASPLRRNFNRAALVGSVPALAYYALGDDGDTSEYLPYAAGAAGAVGAGALTGAKYDGGLKQFGKNVGGNILDRTRMATVDPMGTAIRAVIGNTTMTDQKYRDIESGRRLEQPRRVMEGFRTKDTNPGNRHGSWTTGGPDMDAPTARPVNPDDLYASAGFKATNRAQIDGMIDSGFFNEKEVGNIRAQQARIDEAQRMADTFRDQSPNNLKHRQRVNSLTEELDKMVANPSGTAADKVNKQYSTAGDKVQDFIGSDDKVKKTVDAAEQVAKGAADTVSNTAGNMKSSAEQMITDSREKLNKWTQARSDAKWGSKDWREARSKIKKHARQLAERIEAANLSFSTGVDMKDAMDQVKNPGKFSKRLTKGLKAGGIAEAVNMGLQAGSYLLRDDTDWDKIKKDTGSLYDSAAASVKEGKNTYGQIYDKEGALGVGAEGIRDAAELGWGMLKEGIQLPASIIGGGRNVIANINDDNTGMREYEYDAENADMWGKYNPDNWKPRSNSNTLRDEQILAQDAIGPEEASQKYAEGQDTIDTGLSDIRNISTNPYMTDILYSTPWLKEQGVDVAKTAAKYGDGFIETLKTGASNLIPETKAETVQPQMQTNTVVPPGIDKKEYIGEFNVGKGNVSDKNWSNKYDSLAKAGVTSIGGVRGGDITADGKDVTVKYSPDTIDQLAAGPQRRREAAEYAANRRAEAENIRYASGKGSAPESSIDWANKFGENRALGVQSLLNDIKTGVPGTFDKMSTLTSRAMRDAGSGIFSMFKIGPKDSGEYSKNMSYYNNLLQMNPRESGIMFKNGKLFIPYMDGSGEYMDYTVSDDLYPLYELMYASPR